MTENSPFLQLLNGNYWYTVF